MKNEKTIRRRNMMKRDRKRKKDIKIFEMDRKYRNTGKKKYYKKEQNENKFKSDGKG